VSARAIKGEFSLNDWNILVVEDDPDGQEVVGRMLKHQHIKYDLARSGEDALEMLAKGRYTGAILDLALPGIDGWSLLKSIKNDPKTRQLSCVAVTAYHSTDMAVKAIAAGFSAYFPKPLETTSFVRELQRVWSGN
jgi:CheY-like chemotaxis protein